MELNEKEDSEDESDEWTNIIHRGGLKHVNNLTYTLFATMELALRQHLNSRKVSDISGLKDEAKEKIKTMMYSFTGRCSQ